MFITSEIFDLIIEHTTTESRWETLVSHLKIYIVERILRTRILLRRTLLKLFLISVDRTCPWIIIIAILFTFTLGTGLLVVTTEPASPPSLLLESSLGLFKDLIFFLQLYIPVYNILDIALLNLNICDYKVLGIRTQTQFE
jgi:hypothetical protein